MSSPDYSQDVKDIIDGLGDTPTPDAIYHAVRNYSVDNVVAAAASAAKAGGGGGGGGGGGSLTGKFSTFSGTADSVPTATSSLLTWTEWAGDTFLDLTDPTYPVATVGGLYSISGYIQITSGPYANKTAFGILSLADGDSVVKALARLDPDIELFQHVCIGMSATYPVAVGQHIYAQLYHEVGSSVDAGLVVSVTVQPS